MDWIPDVPSRDVPLYRAIADAIGSDVAAGRLRPGDRLPTQRALAGKLGIDLTTVTRAYADAMARGLIVSEGRRGSFVSARQGQADAVDSGEAATGMNMPPEPADGLLRRWIGEGIAALLADRSAPLHYRPTGGTDAQRASAAAFLAETISRASAERVLVTAGSQNALHGLLTHLLRAGDRIAAGCFTYPGFLGVARRLGAEVVALPMDGEGIIPEALEEAARSGLRALYVVPTNDNPTTATMKPARRREIARIAARHDLAVIEDDVYGRLPERPLPPIAGFAPERTWHIASVSKLISPSLRVGFLLAPSERDAEAVSAIVHETAVMAPPLNVALVTRWLDGGGFTRLIGAVRGEAAARMKEASAILGPLGARWHAEGYHLWLPLDAETNAGRIAAQMIAAGLPAVSSADFAVDPGSAVQALRISLGSSATRARVLREVRRLDAMLTRSGGKAAVV